MHKEHPETPATSPLMLLLGATLIALAGLGGYLVTSFLFRAPSAPSGSAMSGMPNVGGNAGPRIYVTAQAGGQPTQQPVVQTQIAANATLCAVSTTSGTGNYAIIWDLYGTPTPTPSPTPRTISENVTQVAVPNMTYTPSATPYALLLGDPKRGKALFEGAGQCVACHNVQTGGTQLIGPPLDHISTAAQTRDFNISADDYLRESVVNPNFYIVKGYQPGVMPANYEKTLFPQQINDIVAYMSTLK